MVLRAGCCPGVYKAKTISLGQCNIRNNKTEIFDSVPIETDATVFIDVRVFTGLANDKIYFSYENRVYKLTGTSISDTEEINAVPSGATYLDSDDVDPATVTNSPDTALLGGTNLFLIVCLCRKADYDTMLGASGEVDDLTKRRAFNNRYNSSANTHSSTCSRQQYFAVNLLDASATIDGSAISSGNYNTISIGDYITVSGSLKDSGGSAVAAYNSGVGGVGGLSTSTLNEDLFRVIDVLQQSATESLYYKDIAAYVGSPVVKTRLTGGTGAGSGYANLNGCTSCLQGYLGWIKGDTSANTRQLDHIMPYTEPDAVALLNETPSMWPCRVELSRGFSLDTFGWAKDLLFPLAETFNPIKSIVRPIKTCSERNRSGLSNSTNTAYDLTNDKCSESDFSYLDGINGGVTDYFQFNPANTTETQYASDFSWGMSDVQVGDAKSYPIFENIITGQRQAFGPTNHINPGGESIEDIPYHTAKIVDQQMVPNYTGALADDYSATRKITITCEYSKNLKIRQDSVRATACPDFEHEVSLPTVNDTGEYLGNNTDFDYLLNSVTCVVTADAINYWEDVPIVKWNDVSSDLVQPPVFHKLCDIEDGQRRAVNGGTPSQQAFRDARAVGGPSPDAFSKNILKTSGVEDWKNETFGPERVYRCSRQPVERTDTYTGSGGTYTLTGTVTNGDWHDGGTPLIGYHPETETYIARLYSLHNDGSITPFYKYDYYWSNPSEPNGNQTNQPDGSYFANIDEEKVITDDLNRIGGDPFDVVLPVAPIMEFSAGFNVNGFRKVDKLTNSLNSDCQNPTTGRGYGRSDAVAVVTGDSISDCITYAGDCTQDCAYWPPESYKSKFGVSNKETRGDEIEGVKLCMTNYGVGQPPIVQNYDEYLAFGFDNPTFQRQYFGWEAYRHQSCVTESGGTIIDVGWDDVWGANETCTLSNTWTCNCKLTSSIPWTSAYGRGDTTLFINNGTSANKKWRLNGNVDHAFLYPITNPLTRNNGTLTDDASILANQTIFQPNSGAPTRSYRGNGLWWMASGLSGDTFEETWTSDWNELIAKPMLTANSGCVPIDSEWTSVTITSQDPWCRGCTGCLRTEFNDDNYVLMGDPTDNPQTLV